MKVSEFANLANKSSDEILATLKSLRLKATDSEQKLNAAVLAVLRSALNMPEPEKPKKKVVRKATTKKTATKKAVKKTTKKTAKADAKKVDEATVEVNDDAIAETKKKPRKKVVSKTAVKDKDVDAPKVSVDERVITKVTAEQKSNSDTGLPLQPAKGETKASLQNKLKSAKKTALNEEKALKEQAKLDRKKEPTSQNNQAQKPQMTMGDVGSDKRSNKTKKPANKDTRKDKSSVNILKNPVITLKPLGHKRRRNQSGTDSDGSGRRKGFVKTRSGLDTIDTLPENISESTDITKDGLKETEIIVPISVKDLSIKIQQKPSVMLKELMQMGVFAHINQNLDGAVVDHLIGKFGYKRAEIKTEEESLIAQHKMEAGQEEFLESRAPIVTFMGHVDHGKTTLIDYIRKSKVADTEHGGITQAMSAYSVKGEKGKITFFDTPGHEAFTSMRSRGAQVTDIVVVVIAADEGIMPQTEEAIDHARAAGVPIVVALNKIDKPNADADKVKTQLAERELLPEDWGGKTIVAGVSAITGEGVDNLLEMILLESEMLELKANKSKKASGIVVESHLSQGRGVIATLIVQSGTLHLNDFLVIGPNYGKVKALFDDHERKIEKAGPSTPVEIIGLSNTPEAGEPFYVVDDEKSAREISQRRRDDEKNQRLQTTPKLTLEDLYADSTSELKTLNVILKADVQGSLEAIKESLMKLPSQKVQLKFIHTGVGDVNFSDALLAVASKTMIIAFNVGADNRAQQEIEKNGVELREYRIIYDAINDMTDVLEGMLEQKIKKNFQSRVLVQQVFNLTKNGLVAGCIVNQGKLKRKDYVDVIRDEQVIFSGRLSSLKRYKDDVKEVPEGMECGLTIEGFDKYMAGDEIESYEKEIIRQRL